MFDQSRRDIQPIKRFTANKWAYLMMFCFLAQAARTAWKSSAWLVWTNYLRIVNMRAKCLTRRLLHFTSDQARFKVQSVYFLVYLPVTSGVQSNREYSSLQRWFLSILININQYYTINLNHFNNLTRPESSHSQVLMLLWHMTEFLGLWAAPYLRPTEARLSHSNKTLSQVPICAATKPKRTSGLLLGQL